jgi:eukaryotic-like serine/threonine-protein kinase
MSMQHTDPLDPAASMIGIVRSTIFPTEDADGMVSPFRDPDRPRFEAVAEIGLGGVGQVLSAQDLDIGRRVAIKRVRPDKKSSAAFARFVQEVRTVGRLDHPNIVPIYDVGRDEEGGFYFVMKYVDGETLEQILDRLRAGDPAAHRRWTFERRAELFLQMLHAVAFAHARGFLHRDLKPANVMVGEHGEVQLVDWGVSKRIGSLDEEPTEVGDPTAAMFDTRTGSLVGTPRYMAPEQARREPADIRTETWSLCLLFYEILSLRHYLDGTEELDQVLDAIQHREIPNLRTMPRHPHQSAVPHDLAWIVMDGLERDPAKRYPSVEAMIDRLNRRNDGQVKIQCPATLQKSILFTLASWVDRNPTATTVSLLLGALGAATTAVVAAGATVAVVAALVVAIAV